GFGAETAAPDAVHAVAADIFAPCALGEVIDRSTIGALRVKAIAGGANNPLASDDLDEEIARRGILFAPDFVINAGGVHWLAEELATIPGRRLPELAPLAERLAGIRTKLRAIFARARAEGATPMAVAVRQAKEAIGRKASAAV